MGLLEGLCGDADHVVMHIHELGHENFPFLRTLPFLATSSDIAMGGLEPGCFRWQPMDQMICILTPAPAETDWIRLGLFPEAVLT